jgi:sulfate adenylyltransferase
MAARQTPHGGKLIDLFVPDADKAAVTASADKTIDITERQSCDVQLLSNGGLSPLTGFLNEDEMTRW